VRIDPLIVHRPLLFAVAIISTIAIGAIISFSMFYCHMLERAWVNIIDDFERELHVHHSAPQQTISAGFAILTSMKSPIRKMA
jgi:hypothetical protein